MRPFDIARRFGLAVLVLAGAGALAHGADLSGRWEGRWTSCTSGHAGPLKATFCKVGPACYRVAFSGRFFAVIPFRYEVNLRVVNDDGRTMVLAGSSYLGRRYGTFTYRATVVGDKFVADYDSCRDDGRFVLCRRCGP